MERAHEAGGESEPAHGADYRTGSDSRKTLFARSRSIIVTASVPSTPSLPPDPRRPLPTLLSQTLVAFTLELDNEFERQMIQAGFRGIGLSLTVWSNLFRFLSDDGVPVRELAGSPLGQGDQTLPMLGCLERWGFISLDSSPAGERPPATHRHRRSGQLVREGFGSGRGIRQAWLVRLTDKGRRARETWPSVLELIERRWELRFADAVVSDLRAALQRVVDGLDIELPDAIPPGERESFPPRVRHDRTALPLPTLLSKALLAFAVEFDRRSPAPLALCANVLRVIGDDGARVSDLASLTGGSPEVSAIGWRLRPYVAVGAVRGRGRIARLTPAGRAVQASYPRALETTEARWRERFGQEVVDDLRRLLGALFDPDGDGRPRLAAGVIPPAGVRRSGDRAAAPDPFDMTPAEHKRRREMAAQTAAFVEDPGGKLPHFPVWDMNRGFGP